MTDANQPDVTTLWERFKTAFPYLLTAFLFIMGSFALYHLLKPVSFKEVLTQIRATPLHLIVLSILAMFTGYAALIGYDWSALRYLGKKLPLNIVMMGGFLGYALGNTIGAGPVTGGAVRYRIYASLGLTGYDIAAIAIFGSASFGIGAATLGFGALAYHPYALGSLTSLGPQTMQLISIAGLCVTLTILAGLIFSKSEIKVRGNRFKAPSPGLIVGQLIFSAVDIAMAAVILYLLLPPNDMGFVPFLAVFAVATLAGVASHVPGGVGVFETIVIAALPVSVPVDQAAAGLLLYRLIYYILPFVLALLLLSLSELRMARAKTLSPQFEALHPVFRAVSSIVPLAMAAMVFLSGAFMLLSAVIPATSTVAEDMEILLPLGFVEGGALLTSAIGAALLVIAHGLMRRVEGAYWLAILALSAGIMASLLHGLDYERAAILLLMALILLPCRREFYRSARLTRKPLSLRWILLLLSIGVAWFAVFFLSYEAGPYRHDLWWQFAADTSAPTAMRAGLVGALLISVFTLLTALRPPSVRTSLATPDEIAKACAIIATQSDPTGLFATTGDKSLLFSDSGRAFLMYRVQGRSWIALGDPIGDPSEAAQLAWEFVDAANAASGRPVFYEVGSANLGLWAEMGMAMYKMGEEAVVTLSEFSLDGSNRKKLRTVHNRAGRDGLTFEMLPAPVDDDILEVLHKISDQWLLDKNSAEKQFSVGRFDAAYLRQFPIAIVRHEGRPVAFATVLVTDQKQTASIDLMRHVADAPGGLMDYLFTELMLHLKENGYAEFSLGMAPLAGLDTRRGSRWTVKLGAFVYRHGGHFYNFDGLRNFKNKFDPNWRTRFLVTAPRTNVLLVAADAAALISGGMRKAIGKA